MRPRLTKIYRPPMSSGGFTTNQIYNEKVPMPQQAHGPLTSHRPYETPLPAKPHPPPPFILTHPPGTILPAKQSFVPVRPDELNLRTASEPLRIVHAYDDGWCAVERPTLNNQLGVVPAWVFLDPVQGAQPIRPQRVSSLTEPRSAMAHANRRSSQDSQVSWSHL